MSKRPNLFEENCPLQQKKHIGSKEVDSGVDKERRMQLVYERTRMLLFEGGHRCHESAAGRCSSNSLSILNGDNQKCDTSKPLTEEHEGRDAKTRLSTNDRRANGGGDGSGSGSSDYPSTSRNSLRQLRLDASSQIDRHQFAIEVPPTKTTSSSCPSCHRRSSSFGQPKCCFCDKSTCCNNNNNNGCLQRCVNCHGDFCTLCSYKLYDRRDDDDAAICLTCSSL